MTLNCPIEADKVYYALRGTVWVDHVGKGKFLET